MTCKYCQDTGVWISIRDDDAQVIERCDHCKTLGDDASALKLILKVIYSEVEVA